MKVFLVVHLTAGMVSFVLAPVALATAKGGKQHRRWGLVYLYAMGLVSCTALPMAFLRPVLFLALVSMISAYLAFSGYRVLKLKDLVRGGSAQPVDWLTACIAFIASASLVAMGWFRPSAVQRTFRHAGIILWLWPAAIGVPAIILTTAYYGRKFASRQASATAGGLAAV